MTADVRAAIERCQDALHRRAARSVSSGYACQRHSSSWKRTKSFGLAKGARRASVISAVFSRAASGPNVHASGAGAAGRRVSACFGCGRPVVALSVAMIPNPSPRDRGFAMPAEWAPHAAVWTAWPCDDDLWIGELEPMRREFAGLVRALARFEPVHLLVRDDEAEQDARDAPRRRACPLPPRALRRRVVARQRPDLHRAGRPAAPPQLGVQRLGAEIRRRHRQRECRGSSPACSGRRRIDTGIVLEGGSIEVNGAGCRPDDASVSVVARSGTRRSAKRTSSAILQDALGVSQVLWLDTGLEGDHTDGHIDTITRFVDATTIVTVASTIRRTSTTPSRGPTPNACESFRDRRGAVPDRGAAAAGDARRVRRRATAAHLREFLHRQRRRRSCPSTAT